VRSWLRINFPTGQSPRAQRRRPEAFERGSRLDPLALREKDSVSVAGVDQMLPWRQVMRLC